MIPYAVQVSKELRELICVGVQVPKRSLDRCEDDVEMAEYRDNGMSARDCADLLISLEANR